MSTTKYFVEGEEYNMKNEFEDVLRYLRENTIFVNYNPLNNHLIFNLTQLREPNGCVSLDANKVILGGYEKLIQELESRKKCQENC